MDSRTDEYESAAAGSSSSVSSSASTSWILDHYDLVSSSLYINSNQLQSFILKFTWNWTTIALLIMRPETLTLVTAVILILCLSLTFDLWAGVIAANVNKISRHASWIKFFSSVKSSNDPADPRISFFTSGLQDSYHLKQESMGVFAIRGRRAKMEDMFDYVNEIDKLGIELFGVFDGHGSDKASIFTRKHLFPSIVSRISAAVAKKETGGGNNNSNSSNNVCPASPRATAKKAAATCDHDSASEFTSFLQSNRILSSEIKKIVSEEILALDGRMLALGRRDMDFGGTTAIIAVRLHSLNRLLVANVGDSRGVLCNSRGMTVPLSHDHKPQNPVEHRRIKDAGGFIKFNGVWRVAGILATSRALGDSLLKDKKFITADPDILMFDLSDHQPQFIILASDGLWDIFTNDEAVRFVKESLSNWRKRGRTENLAYEAARSLTLEAYKRLSLDNITILIVLFDPKEFHSMSTSFGIYSSHKHKLSNGTTSGATTP